MDTLFSGRHNPIHGGLTALSGQIYQTGADPWRLFAGWGLLVFFWVFAGRFAAETLLFVCTSHEPDGLMVVVMEIFYNITTASLHMPRP